MPAGEHTTVAAAAAGLPRGIVGRERERRRLRRAVGAAVEGQGVGLLLRGPAGIGKSTLLRWLEADARARGLTVRRIGATAAHLEPPLGLWTRLAGQVTADGVAAPPALTEGSPGGLTAPERYRAALALVRGLARAGTATVLLADDLHEADASSLLLALELLPELEGAPVAVVGALRGEDAHRDAAGRDVLHRLAREVDALDLDGFDREALAALVMTLLAQWDAADGDEGDQDAAHEDAAGEEGDGGEGDGEHAAGEEGEADRAWAREAADALQVATGGSPLLVADLLRALGVAEGRRPDREAITAAGQAGEAPRAAARVLASLPDEATTTLAVLAGLGEDTEAVAVAEVMGACAHDALSRAAGAGVVELDGGRARFAHPSLREAAERLPLQAATHRAIAEAAARRARPGDRQVEMTHLAAAGGHATRAEVLDAARRAAEDAQRVGDFAGAARALEVAIDHHPGNDVEPDPDVPRLTALRLDAARASHRAGLRAQGWAHARAAAAPGLDPSPDELADAALLLAEGREFRANNREPRELLTAAAARLEAADPRRAEVLATLSSLTLFDPGAGADDADPAAPSAWLHRVGEARALADQAVAVVAATREGEAERAGGRSPQGDVAARVALAWRLAHSDPAHHAQRREASARAAARAVDPVLRGRALVAACLDAFEAGDAEDATARWREATALARQTGDLRSRWQLAVVEAMRARAQGQLATAHHARAQALAAGQRAGEPGAQPADLALGALLDLEVDLDGPTLQAFIALSEQVDSSALRAGSAWALALRGRTSQAQALLDQVVAALTGRSDREGEWLIAAAQAAEAAATLGAHDHAATLREALAPWRSLIAVDVLNGLGTLGCVARPLARLLAITGEPAAAEAAFEEAAQRDAAAGLELSVVRGHVDRLAARAHADQPPDEDEVAALATRAQAMGATILAARARALAAPPVSERLTERQHAVLAGLVAGATYGAIADDLGYAHTTIRKDVLAIYRLLGVHDRDAAVAEAQRLGLVG